MDYTAYYESKLGTILLASDGMALTGLWFMGQKHFAASLSPEHLQKELPVFEQTRHWLNIYFVGTEPEFMPPILLRGTPFQKEVWELLLAIPYGTVTTYGALAALLAEKHGIGKMSARAVGGAVGRNPISLIVPCHRVVGSGHALTGYAGGVEKKLYLLRLEKQNFNASDGGTTEF